MLKLIIPFLFVLFGPNTSAQQANHQKEVLPNIVIIFTDDMGYGDIGVYGHPTISTPNLDKMAMEGQKWTNFYVAASVCTPSRAGLLTGRLPIRYGMAGGEKAVIFPNAKGGLPTNENTIASILKHKKYQTACIGKWHLGDSTPYFPNAHGFDYYFGIPYSNDMDRIVDGTDYMEACKNPKIEDFNVPLMRNSEIIERPADQNTITKRYTQEAVKFIKENKRKPFFLYLATNMPHVPLFTSNEFKKRSKRGKYGDAVEELDWTVGQVLKTLKENKLEENTLVVFTSDNGPWLMFDELGGSAGLLRSGKGDTFEGGMRVPAIFYWPKKIKPGVVMELGTTMDLLPTIASLAKIQLTTDRIYDGYDISPVLLKNEKAKRDVVFYYQRKQIWAIRKGDYKSHFTWKKDGVTSQVPLLFNLSIDPSEKYNIAKENPKIVQEITKIRNEHLATIKEVKDQF